MAIIICLILLVALMAFWGYMSKTINESKGYSGGFWYGALLSWIGVMIVAFRKDLPNADPKGFKAVPVQNVMKKYRYPFGGPPIWFEPIDILKDSAGAKAEAGKYNLAVLLIFSAPKLLWYSVVLGLYFWYLMGYTIRWMFSKHKK